MPAMTPVLKLQELKLLPWLTICMPHTSVCLIRVTKGSVLLGQLVSLPPGREQPGLSFCSVQAVT